MPGVQMPHCAAPHSRKAFCSGCNRSSFAKPSIVTMLAPRACSAGIKQLFTSTPSIRDRKSTRLNSSHTEIYTFPYTTLFRSLRIFIEQIHCGEDHARSADAALRCTAFKEGFLQRMQSIVVCQAFNRDNARSACL